MKRFLHSFRPPTSHLRIIGDKTLRAATQIFFCACWAGCGLVRPSLAQSYAPDLVTLTGRVLDPQGAAVPGAALRLESPAGLPKRAATCDARGSFAFPNLAPGDYILIAEASGFASVNLSIAIEAGRQNFVEVGFLKLAGQVQQVNVVAATPAVLTPDPGEQILSHDDVLDANPGRPGAPISIPGLPVETASGGIKAPQYFVPGVAGDHGEPIAQYIAVGGYRVSNNLSANAHGNGYADPNIYIAAVLGNVETDGGAFNVLEGNHALNLAATYSLRPQARPFVTLTGDYRDLDLTVGIAPADSTKKEWLALEANYGNGLMRLLEHRQQYKWNAMRILNPGNHQITLVSIGYWGESHEGNLVPLGLGLQVNDTIDPRQKDQTHTSIFAADDQWQAGTRMCSGSPAFFAPTTWLCIRTLVKD